MRGGGAPLDLLTLESHIDCKPLTENIGTVSALSRARITKKGMEAMNSRRLLCQLGAVAALTVASVSTAQAIQIRVNMTVDNSYALFYGTENAATNFVGSDFDWPTTETYNFNLPSGNYLYIVTASDLSTAQGLLGQFENLDEGYKFYSQDSQWEVMATGLGNTGAPYTGSSADLALLSQEILDANAGGNASQGWVATTEGPANGSSPWGLRPNIDQAANWVWHSANGDTDPTSPGFNHDEWLVFRIAVAATPNTVPEAGTLGLLGLGLVGIAFARRRRQ